MIDVHPKRRVLMRHESHRGIGKRRRISPHLTITFSQRRKA